MALTVLPLAGEIVPASKWQDLLNERFPLPALKTADQDVGPSNVTLQNITQASVAMAANATYRFALALQYSTNGTADIKIGFTGPAGFTMDYITVGSNAAAVTNFGVGIQTTVVDFGGNVTSAFLYGTVVTTNAGTLQLQAAQNTSNASSTLVSAGTLLELVRIA